MSRAAEALRFVEGTTPVVIDRPAFGLVVTFTGDAGLWAPYSGSTGSLVAIAGRLAFDDAEWEAERASDGSGGRAAEIVYARYQRHGVAGLEGLNGNAAVVAYDEARQIVHLVTDCCGVLPAFEVEASQGWLYGSHPDVLADAANELHRLDETSLAEFILSGTVTPPFSHYERVRASDYGTIFTFDLAANRPGLPTRRRHFDFAYRGEESVPEQELACQLGAALRRAVQRRSHRRLGRTAVALSGGLDSRIVLASARDTSRVLAFSCYDEPNRELTTAATIAQALGAPFLPLRRGPDYYADHAEGGVRISGGMGTFANNHFLGVLSRLQDEGMDNLMTGCYCDYLFKGLPLNRRVHWFTRQETLGPYGSQFYFDHFRSSTTLAGRARDRWESRVPEELRTLGSAQTVFEVEARRTFPLSYEGDNQQRLVPQRVTGWCPPFVDREVLDIYCRVPYAYKLNRSLFRKTVRASSPELRTIPDANTGALVDASPASEWLRGGQVRLRRKWRRMLGSGATDESWPHWQRYVLHSRKLDELWRRPNPDAMDLFRRVLDTSTPLDDADALKRRQPFLFVGLLTVKLWLEQRA